MLIDTHAHLDYDDFTNDLEAVIDRAVKAGVTRILTIGTSLESSYRAVMLAERFDAVYAVVGVHPSNAHEAPDDVMAPLRELAGSPRVVAIGETGLDFHRLPSGKLQEGAATPFISALGSTSEVEMEATMMDGVYKDAQAKVFQEQLDLAVELGLNVAIHQRDAWQETLQILQPYTGKVRGVFHCFGGDLQSAGEVVALGHLVSFTGTVTFKNAHQVRDTAGKVAKGNYMVETDCPYLAPEPYRGKRAEPAYTREVAQAIASARGETFEEVAAETTQTAEGFFRFRK